MPWLTRRAEKDLAGLPLHWRVALENYSWHLIPIPTSVRSCGEVSKANAPPALLTPIESSMSSRNGGDHPYDPTPQGRLPVGGPSALLLGGQTDRDG